MNNNILYDEQAIDLIYQGIDKVKKTIVKTLGPNGKNVLIGKKYNNLIINDGYTIINNITSDNYYERIGINICKSIVRRINDNVGDGTTSSIIIFSEILKKGIEKIKENISVVSIIEYLNNSLEILLNEIDKYSKSITINNIEQVLITSTKEQNIINNVKNAYGLVKEEGIILLKETNGIDYIEQNNGYFILLKSKYNKIILNDYQVLLLNDYIDSISCFNKVLKEDKKIIFLVKDASNEVINFFKLYNEKNGSARIFIINQSISEINSIFEDLSYLLNIKVCYKELIDTNYLSDKVKLILDKDKLVFNLTSSILIDKLKDELKETTSLVKRKQIKNRLAKLTNGFVSIYVGGNTLEEQQYKLLKYEDTIKTGYNALTDGIVIGGGYIYYKLANKLDNIYINILKEALMMPIIQLLKNNNEDVEKILNQLNEYNWYDPIKKEVVNINQFNIYDATKTIKEILKVSISNVVMLLNTTAVIINQEESDYSIDNLL
ncbi:MAG: hypothetical protein IJE45_04445 [Bacilli bacterium]|nr:hypothetical protein [Bacilli bacterium]